MSETVALILFGALIVFAIFCGWRGARPPNISKGPRLMPWRALMVTASCAALIDLAYVAFLQKGG